MLVMHTDIKLSYEDQEHYSLLITDAEGKTVTTQAYYSVFVPGITQGLVWLGCGFICPDSIEDRAKMRGRRSLRLYDGACESISVSANRGTIDWRLISNFHSFTATGFGQSLVRLRIPVFNGQPFIEGTLRFYYTTEAEMNAARGPKKLYDVLQDIETTHSNEEIE